jgi:hypothetical protein
MSNKFTEIVIPFEWDSWDEIDILFTAFYNVTFIDDFGVFTKGETFSSISINYAKGTIEAYNDEDAVVIKTQKFIAKPV